MFTRPGNHGNPMTKHGNLQHGLTLNTGWWFGTMEFWWLSIQLGMEHHPNWRFVHHFSEGWRKTTNQIINHHLHSFTIHLPSLITQNRLNQSFWAMFFNHKTTAQASRKRPPCGFAFVPDPRNDLHSVCRRCLWLDADSVCWNGRAKENLSGGCLKYQFVY